MKLMIVDDHAGVREMIRALVCSPDDQVRECESADDAVRVAPEFNPDFITMDLWMPGLNSFKGIQAVLKANPTCRIVVVTAYDQHGLREAAKEAGAADYVLKENLTELRATMKLPPLTPVLPAPPTTRKPPEHHINSGMRSPVAQMAARVEELEFFPGFVANELRGPLQILESSVATLRAPGATLHLPPDIAASISRLETACVEMKRRIDALLHFTNSASDAIEWQAFAPEKLIREIWDELSKRGRRDQVCFKLFRMPAVSGDKTLLRLAFAHLLDNAVKFSASRSNPVIEVNCCDVGSYSVFAVTDNGIGFDPEQADKLFLPLGRLHPKEDYPGLGLGLALTRRIIHQHGGRIWADGKPGQGTTVYFTLPRPATS